MEKSPQFQRIMVNAGFRPERSASYLDKDEPMAIGDEMVGVFVMNLIVQLLIEERPTWPVRAVLVVRRSLLATSFQILETISNVVR